MGKSLDKDDKKDDKKGNYRRDRTFPMYFSNCTFIR